MTSVSTIRDAGFDVSAAFWRVSENVRYAMFAGDGLMMTLDCSLETVERLTNALDEAVAEGVILYGLHQQDEALMTCAVPSVLSSDHMHFIDGSDGGYASAAKMLHTHEGKGIASD